MIFDLRIGFSIIKSPRGLIPMSVHLNFMSKMLLSACSTFSKTLTSMFLAKLLEFWSRKIIGSSREIRGKNVHYFSSNSDRGVSSYDHVYVSWIPPAFFNARNRVVPNLSVEYKVPRGCPGAPGCTPQGGVLSFVM